LLIDACSLPAGSSESLCDALDAAGPYGAGWPSPKIAAGPARLLRTGIVGDGHVRGLACGDDGKSFKWIAFRSAADGAWPGAARSPADRAGGWPEASGATSGTAAMRPKCISRTPRSLDRRRSLP
jgi:single-stranded-DNA-specific exonuclease